MQIVRPGFRDEAHIATQPAVLSRNDTFDDLNLANSVRTHDIDFRKAAITTEQIGGGKAAGIGSIGCGRHRGSAKPIHAEAHTTRTGNKSLAFC